MTTKKTELTRDRLLECLARVKRAAAAPRPFSVRPPRFIAEMTDREVAQWDVELYQLAIRALDREAAFDTERSLRAQLAQARAAVGEAWFAGGVTLAEAIARKTKALEAVGADANVCEHGDHPAPAGQRFCSAACKECDAADCDNDEECAGLCEPARELRAMDFTDEHHGLALCAALDMWIERLRGSLWTVTRMTGAELLGRLDSLSDETKQRLWEAIDHGWTESAQPSFDDPLLDATTPKAAVDAELRGMGLDPEALRAEGAVFSRSAMKRLAVQRGVDPGATMRRLRATEAARPGSVWEGPIAIAGPGAVTCPCGCVYLVEACGGRCPDPSCTASGANDEANDG